MATKARKKTTQKKTAAAPKAAEPRPRRLNGPATARYIGWAPQTLVNKRHRVRHGLLPEDAVPPVHESDGAASYYLIDAVDAWLDARGARG